MAKQKKIYLLWLLLIVTETALCAGAIAIVTYVNRCAGDGPGFVSGMLALLFLGATSTVSACAIGEL